MDQDRIVLDKKAFGALAVDSRVKLLKALTLRRKMLTELAAELKLSASATKEHLDTLVEAGLIEKFDEGHKWKYYALTRKGAGIVTPDREIKVWVILGISIIGLILSSLLMLNSLPASATMQAPQVATAAVPAPAAVEAPGTNAQAGPSLGTTAIEITNTSVGAAEAAANNVSAEVVPEGLAAPLEGNPPFSPYMALSALCALVAAVCVVYLVIDRMR